MIRKGGYNEILELIAGHSRIGVVISPSREGGCGKLSGGMCQTVLVRLTVRQEIDANFDLSKTVLGLVPEFLQNRLLIHPLIHIEIDPVSHRSSRSVWT